VKIVISAEAKADLFEIRQYIARDNPVAAKREILRIKQAIQLLATGTVEGRRVILRSGLEVNLWLVSSYRLYYRRIDKQLQVLHVYHQARRPIEH
jgi:plasmid stabilization system protein ParE